MYMASVPRQTVNLHFASLCDYIKTVEEALKKCCSAACMESIVKFHSRGGLN